MATDAEMKKKAQQEAADAKLQAMTDKAYQGSLTNTESLPYRPKGGLEGMLKGGSGDMKDAQTLPDRITPGRKRMLDKEKVQYKKGGRVTGYKGYGIAKKV